MFISLSWFIHWYDIVENCLKGLVEEVLLELLLEMFCYTKIEFGVFKSLMIDEMNERGRDE